MKDRKGLLNQLVTITNCLLGFIVLLGSFLVLAGYAHRIGYLNSFGINVGVLPTQLYESLGQAFYIGFVFAGDLILNLGRALLAILIFVTLLALIFGIFKWFGSAENKIPLLIWFINFEKESKKPMTWQRFIKVEYEELQPLVLFICISFVILVAVCGPLISSYKMGREEGDKQLRKFSEVSFDCAALTENTLNCIQIVNIETGQIISEGLSISGESDSYHALHNGKSIEVFPTNSNHKVIIYPSLASQ